MSIHSRKAYSDQVTKQLTSELKDLGRQAEIEQFLKLPKWAQQELSRQMSANRRLKTDLAEAQTMVKQLEDEDKPHIKVGPIFPDVPAMRLPIDYEVVFQLGKMNRENIRFSAKDNKIEVSVGARVLCIECKSGNVAYLEGRDL